jgi:hypothetical protein
LDNLINSTKERIPTLKEEEVGEVVDVFLDYFSNKIISLSNYVYGSNAVALASFKEQSAKTLDNAVRTFTFKSQHWRTGRDIEHYLASCLNRLAYNISSNIDCKKKVISTICPACKALGNKEFLFYDNKLLKCAACCKEVERLENQKRTAREEYEYRIRKVYSFHSKKGYRCPSCDRFIPKSFIGNQIRVSCPFDNCDWFGIASELEIMPHPMGQNNSVAISLNNPVIKGPGDNVKTEFQDILDAKSINPDLLIEKENEYKLEYNTIKDVLSIQTSRLEMVNKEKNIKKLLMYTAFEKILENDPAAMIGYLIHGKSYAERPIQSLIFQKYVQLVENKLPFKVKGDEGYTDAYSLLDPNLALFLGISEYISYVKDSGFVDNNTHEVFTGAKCNGPCFIGMLCDIKNNDGISLLKEVEYYSFSNIKMKSTVGKNTMVKVTHFRIPPHYDMYSLVNLQRVRKKIVESVHRKLNIKPKGKNELHKITC